MCLAHANSKQILTNKVLAEELKESLNAQHDDNFQINALSHTRLQHPQVGNIPTYRLDTKTKTSSHFQKIQNIQ
jgi:hypothetical protein